MNELAHESLPVKKQLALFQLKFSLPCLNLNQTTSYSQRDLSHHCECVGARGKKTVSVSDGTVEIRMTGLTVGEVGSDG